MGRGRSGITDQSKIKPKIGKIKRRGTDFEIRHSPCKQENRPPLAIDHIVAQMKKMHPQDVMNLLIPNQSN